MNSLRGEADMVDVGDGVEQEAGPVLCGHHDFLSRTERLRVLRPAVQSHPRRGRIAVCLRHYV